jgi:uncharacterized tellurite resistance protein B-like protein
MLDQLSSEERLQLMRFVCSFAWADLEIQDAERRTIGSMILRLDLSDEEIVQVQGWLVRPPDPEDIDPLDVPTQHRQLLLDMVLQVISADGHIEESESDTFNLLSQLLHSA